MKKKYLIALSAALFVIFLDQLTKLLIRRSFQPNESVPMISSILHLTYVTNTGSAFGLFRGFNLIFIIFSIIVVIAVFYFIRQAKENRKALQLSLGLLMGGTIGNLVDRLLYGYVTDFIDFRVWPVFNVADSAVTVSVIFLIILLWRED